MHHFAHQQHAQRHCTSSIQNLAFLSLSHPPHARWCRRVSHYLLENGGDGQMTPLLRLGSGACAGIIGMTATYPLDMVRGRLTVQAGKEYTGILHATRMIVKQVHIYFTLAENKLAFFKSPASLSSRYTSTSRLQRTSWRPLCCPHDCEAGTHLLHPSKEQAGMHLASHHEYQAVMHLHTT